MGTKILVKVITEDFKLSEHSLEQIGELPRHVAVGSAILFRFERGR